MGRKGMTLIEIMIVVALIAIMAAVAVGIYRPYIRKARRSDAFSALKACYAAQEMYKAEHGRYACSFDDLPGCDNTSAGEYYTLSLVSDSVNSTCNGSWFSVIADPKGGQAGDFAFCINEEGKEYYGDDGASGRCPGGNWTECEWEKL